MFYSRLTGLKMSTALASVLIASAGGAIAGPTGGQVVGGDASISTPDSNTTVIDQNSNRGIIEWNTFNLGSGEQLRFNQPDADAITLNRVTGGQGPSTIDGRIDSNGRIIISNRDGIVFGDGAAIDVGALIATTADIENDAFMSGSLEFNRSGNPEGSVINRGTISAKDGGLIALVAPHAENSGILSARVGKVAVAGGDRFTIDFSGSEFLRLAIDPENPAAKYLAKNSGRIEAEGGHVLLTTQTASDALSGVVNNSGIVEATAVDTSGGRIRLVAGGGAKVRNSGTVRSRGTTGGTIEITAEQVELTKTSVIDASGDTGGGTVLVGGDYLGGNAELAALNPLAPRLEDYPVHSASALIAETGAQVHADALSYGDGGKVVFWSNDYTVTGATITARGGLSFGNGGFVETSGGFLDVRTAADTSATNGKGGTWLLDPRDITIVEGVPSITEVIISDEFIIPALDDSEVSAILIEAQLNAGNEVIVSTLNTDGNEDGDIIVDADITKSRGADTTLTLLAEDDLIINSGVDIESNSGELEIALVARDQIRARNIGDLDPNGGNLVIVSGDDVEISTDSRLPNIGITSFAGETASRVDVELDFQDDHIEFTYTDSEVEVPTGGFQLIEFSGGDILVALEGSPRDLILNDSSFLLNDGRGDDITFENFSSLGTNEDDALNGRPEVINYADIVSRNSFGIDPPSGIVPVIEVSTDEGLTVELLLPTSPEGQDIVAALGEPEEPTQPAPPVEEPSDPEAPQEEPNDDENDDPINPSDEDEAGEETPESGGGSGGSDPVTPDTEPDTSSQDVVFGIDLEENTIGLSPLADLRRPLTTQPECITVSCFDPVGDLLSLINNEIDDWQQAQINIEQLPDTSNGERLFRATVFTTTETLQVLLVPEEVLELILLPAAGLGKIVGGANRLRSLGVSDDVVLALPPGRIENPALLLPEGISRGFGDLASERARLELSSPGGGNPTMASLEINGQKFYGVSSSAQNPQTAMTLDRVNPITLQHAEADVVQRALNSGLRAEGGVARMWVDTDLCGPCGDSGGMRSLARNLGVDELIVHTPEGTFRFPPTI